MFDQKKYTLEMDKIVEFFKQNMKSVRTGRAHTSMLDGVKVEVYGTMMPLNQTANVTVTDAQLITVSPFDINNLTNIVMAIRNDQTLGLNPTDDGKIIRVPIPSLTEERRLQIVKQAKVKVEDAKISIRNVRQDALKELKTLKDNKQVSEDQIKSFEKQVQDLVSQTQDQIEQIFKDKEKEITTI